MRHVASRWGRQGVTANCVSPGFVLTLELIAAGQAPQSLMNDILAATPSTRVGNVDDVAAMIAMLLSDDARWINGQIININGGNLMQ